MLQILPKGNPFLTAEKGENFKLKIKDFVNHLSFKYQILYSIPKFDCQHFVLVALNVSMTTPGSYSGIPIFRTSKGNENWFKKISQFETSRVKLQCLIEERERFLVPVIRRLKKMRVREIGIPLYL